MPTGRPHDLENESQMAQRAASTGWELVARAAFDEPEEGLAHAADETRLGKRLGPITHLLRRMEKVGDPGGPPTGRRAASAARMGRMRFVRGLLGARLCVQRIEHARSAGPQPSSQQPVAPS